MAMVAANSPSSAAAADRWYRQPILWLGALILATIIAGCIWTIVVAARYQDYPVHPSNGRVLGVPTAHPAPAASSSP